MADTQKKDSSSTGPILGIIGSVLLPIIFSIILFVALSGKANGTSTMQPISPAPGSSESTALNSLLAMSNKDAFMAANASQISELIAQATQTQTSLTNADAAYKSVSVTDKQTALSILADILSKLTQLQQADQKTSSIAQGLADDVKRLNSILPSIGGQLNVPTVTQGNTGWCGRTAMDEIALFYNQGQIPAGFESAFTGNGTNLTSAKSYGRADNGPSAGQLDKMTAKPGWKQVHIGNKNVQQLFSAIKASINGGDPILMYTYGVYYPGPHIVAVTGYDEATHTVIANNSAIPLYGGTKKNVWTRPNSKNPVPITVELIYQQIAATEKNYGGHSFIIQSKYWN